MVVGPAAIWIAWRRGFRVVHEAWPALLGALVGASPWIAYNVIHGFASLESKHVQPVASISQAGSNVVYFLTTNIPRLLLARPVGLLSTANAMLLTLYAIVLVGLGRALIKNCDLKDGESPRSLASLTLLIFAFALVLNAFSEAGSSRNWTVRFVLPVYVMVPPLIAISIRELGSLSRPIAVLTAAAILGINISLYSLPGTTARAELTTKLDRTRQLQTLLAEANVQALFGNFWLVNATNFDSQRRILGIPSKNLDYLRYADRLPKSGVKWAFITRHPEVLRACVKDARGSTVDLGTWKVFLAQAPYEGPTAELVDSLTRRECSGER